MTPFCLQIGRMELQSIFLIKSETEVKISILLPLLIRGQGEKFST
jgi:hypothetical protein